MRFKMTFAGETMTDIFVKRVPVLGFFYYSIQATAGHCAIYEFSDLHADRSPFEGFYKSIVCLLLPIAVLPIVQAARLPPTPPSAI